MLRLIDSFVSLFYPMVCVGCGNTLYHNEEIICTYCRFHLPRTNYHKDPDNALNKVFWGRVAIENVTAMYFFTKAGKVQHMLHLLKYRNKPEIGVFLGKLYGNDLKETDSFGTVDVIIPVPLHTSKMKKRGYNQSEKFAMGLSQSMGKPLDTSSLVRKIPSETQTKKGRFSRWENVKEIFHLNDTEKIMGKHVLLVDDVITTGATIEACATKLLNLPGTKVSVAAIACTQH